MTGQQTTAIRTSSRRRGAAAVMAMVFLSLMATLAIAMYSTASINVQSSANLAHVNRARAVAETGLRWQAYRLLYTVKRPIRKEGNITADVATLAWPALKDAIVEDWKLANATGNKNLGNKLVSSAINSDNGGGRFTLTTTLLAYDPTTGAAYDPPMLRVSSTGEYNGAFRTASMDFTITKKIKYALVGKVPIQLGRNTIVEGPIATTTSKNDPLFMLSDFMHLTASLTSKMETWNDFLANYHEGYDNRISINNDAEFAKATEAGYKDVTEDGYIDEYDLFFREFDTNNDGRIDKQTEFTKSGGGYIDENLFTAIDNISPPLTPDEAARRGLNDGFIDKYDGYAKLRGEVTMSWTEADWQEYLATKGKTINDMIQGAVTPSDPNEEPITFGMDASDVMSLDPTNFEECAKGFQDRSGANTGRPAVRVAGKIANTTLAAADTTYSAPAVQVLTLGKSTAFKVGQIVLKTAFDTEAAKFPLAADKPTRYATVNYAQERTPLGSTSYQATFRRPIFKDMVLENVMVPKGLNAVFDNCKFIGVTWVDTERNIALTTGGTPTTSSSDGMKWAQKAASGTTAYNKDLVIGVGGAHNTLGSTMGNNLRFNDCAFEGPVANNYATAYTHFANSWEFTGSTTFANKEDQTATIVAPQTNIEMGSFTKPSESPSTLIGVVVAGNIDIRGTSVVDGSIIITGDGAGNTTLAYFGGSDSETNPGAMPEGGFGRLNIRYNEKRALPDGIMIPIDLMVLPRTYTEGLK